MMSSTSIGRMGMLSLMVGVALATAAQAAKESYKVDAAHSSVAFRIMHIDTSYVYGLFGDPEGSFVVDTTNPENNSFNIVVKVANINTAIKGRDEHLQSEDFFNAAQFPKIAFTSTSIRKIADRKFEMAGKIALLGKEKEVKVMLEETGHGEMRGQKKIGFHAIFTIKLSEFGIEWQGLGDEITLMTGLQGNLQSGQAAAKIEAEHVTIRMKQAGKEPQKTKEVVKETQPVTITKKPLLVSKKQEATPEERIEERH